MVCVRVYVWVWGLQPPATSHQATSHQPPRLQPLATSHPATQPPNVAFLTLFFRWLKTVASHQPPKDARGGGGGVWEPWSVEATKDRTFYFCPSKWKKKMEHFTYTRAKVRAYACVCTCVLCIRTCIRTRKSCVRTCIRMRTHPVLSLWAYLPIFYKLTETSFTTLL